MRWAALGSNLFLYYHLIIFYCMAAWYYMSFICRSHGPRCHRIPLDDPLPLGRFTWIRGRHLSWVFCSPNPSSHLTKSSMPRHSGPSEKIGKALSYEMYLGHCWYNWWKDAVHHWWKDAVHHWWKDAVHHWWILTLCPRSLPQTFTVC